MNSSDILRALGQDTGLSQIELAKIRASAPFRYKHYQLKKRSGGFRDIYHPAPELKAIQWWIVVNILAKLPVHQSVFSYREGRGIRDHAAVHLGSRYFLRFDFSNFFPSIKYSDVYELLFRASRSRALELDKDGIALIARFVCRAPKGSRANVDTLALSIGAPSSPALSNAILFDLDSSLWKICNDADVRYSRYADDLYFSTPHANVLEEVKPLIVGEINSLKSPRLTINNAKTSNTSKKNRVQVTGVVITTEEKLSVGRARKRVVKSLVHRYIQGDLPPDVRPSLRGMIAFIHSIEPSFANTLKTKYGHESIDRLLRGDT